jgi:hypothetical protein
LVNNKVISNIGLDVSGSCGAGDGFSVEGPIAGNVFWRGVYTGVEVGLSGGPAEAFDGDSGADSVAVGGDTGSFKLGSGGVPDLSGNSCRGREGKGCDGTVSDAEAASNMLISTGVDEIGGSCMG